MNRKDAEQAFALIAANYVKRWMEGHVYDPLIRTNVGKALEAQGPTTKYGIELALNLLAAYFDHSLSGDTVLKRLVKEIGIDAAPEISKRLVNNSHTESDRHIAETLLDLDPKEMVSLLTWLYETPSAERRDRVAFLTTLDNHELSRFAQLPPDMRRQLLDLLRLESPPTTTSTLSNPRVARATKRLREARQLLRDMKRKENG